MENIVIVGFMGTGKTTVAKALADELRKTYVNIDDLIELREKRTINEIFRDDGEAYFREVEKKIVEEVSRKTDQIIDAGGGVVLDEENMANLRKNGTIICLWADTATVLERTKKYSHRPLLNVEDPMKKIEELLEYRRPFYEKADFHVDSASGNIDSVIERIKEIIHEKKEENP
ncbi:MAG: shikimate kinase [Candidatus Omnitrophota bacterium]|jgi:shikimate kinase